MEELSQDNIEVVSVLQESERFLVQKVLYDGSDAVLKTAKSDEMLVNLQDEIQAYAVYSLMTKEENCPFTTAEILAKTDREVLLSFLPGTEMSNLINNDNQESYYKKLIEIMAFCDKFVRQNPDAMPEVHTEDHIRRAEKSIKRNFDNIDQYDFSNLSLDPTDLRECRDFIVERAEALEICFVNNDLVPGHVMVDGDTLALFDFENVRASSVRFNDVINFVTKPVFMEGNTELAGTLLEEFIRGADVDMDQYKDQIKSLIFGRCIGFTGELITEPNDMHNTSLTMNETYARNITSGIEWGRSL